VIENSPVGLLVYSLVPVIKSIALLLSLNYSVSLPVSIYKHTDQTVVDDKRAAAAAARSTQFLDS
jgi:hypothetical protein